MALDASACCYLHDEASNRVSRSRRSTDVKKCFLMAHCWRVLQLEGRVKLRFEPRPPSETMRLVLTTPCLQIRPIRTVANADEQLRQIRAQSGRLRTGANGYGR